MNFVNESPYHLFSKYGEKDSIYPKSVLEKNDFYRSWKPYLFASGFYDFILRKESYFEFQNKISTLAEEPNGVSLALSCMVEVNVAGGILLHSKYPNPGSHFVWDAFLGVTPPIILSVGVSEPGFEGKIKKLQSSVVSGKLTGIKSFVTNGGEANFVFWVTKSENENPVYIVPIPKESNFPYVILKESFHTDFTPHVSHLKIQVNDLPLVAESLLIEDYGELGMELRLKELCSLVSLLIGKTKVLSTIDSDLNRERNKLIQWRESFLQGFEGNPTKEMLLEGFPYPILPLLLSVTKYYQLEKPEDLKTIDPDWQLFVWEDSLTKYLTQLKKRSQSP
ncbi:acyl-CoA dehydrogenase [Leptospira levettii]|uniref:Acyl-CoA dehydrogenase n=1 Tax=Leptospira levettii TaxID=2023178 RepID=A0ABY2MKG9_9LEPT|nr:acyl-CoA dehydrogenase [Leptospira levettii]TGM33241.1 acyl-CoA dehydrogenase [Leptospira levettii]